jgi:hypothetical protein
VALEDFLDINNWFKYGLNAQAWDKRIKSLDSLRAKGVNPYAGKGISGFLDRVLRFGTNSKAHNDYIDQRMAGKVGPGMFESVGDLGLAAAVIAPWAIGGGCYAAGLGKIGGALKGVAGGLGKEAAKAAVGGALSGIGGRSQPKAQPLPQQTYGLAPTVPAQAQGQSQLNDYYEMVRNSYRSGPARYQTVYR